VRDSWLVEIRSLGYRTDLMVLRLGGSQVTDRGDHIVVRSPHNPTFWWGNFVLFDGPGDVAERLKLFAAEFPYAEHVAWGIDSVDGTAGDEPVLTAAGFSIGRDVVLTASDVNEPPRPNTVAGLRALRTDADWEQELELRVATSDQTGAEHREYLARKVAVERAMCERGGAVWFGAFDGDRLRASLGLVHDGSGLARYQSVGTHPDSRGRGLASTLVHHAARHGFDVLGAERLMIVADPEYLAIRIYRSLGFADTETQVQLTRAPGAIAP
jgi:ribosomal protein S18 acetylase RimI-like enzyme